jgi:dynactin complex subunit
MAKAVRGLDRPFRLSRGQSLDVKNAEDALIIVRDVMKGKIYAASSQLERIRSHFEGLQRVPHKSFEPNVDEGAALRTLSRFVQFAEYLIERAAIGDFPGPTPRLSQKKVFSNDDERRSWVS